jgi:hypothetical protein
MRISYSTLALLDQYGDKAAHVILRAWKDSCGLLWESCDHSTHYCPKLDYFVILQPEGQQVFAPCLWGRKPTGALDLDLSDMLRYQER